MKYRFYTRSDEAWEAMRGALLEAKKSIYWESYIFTEDELAAEFVGILKEKAQSGVRIKLILDSLGSFRIFSSFAADLKNYGVEVLYFNPFSPLRIRLRLRMGIFLRTHRKLLLIDDKVGFLGGVNIGKAYKHWHDLHLKVEGNIVRRLVKSFIKSYKVCGGKDEIVLPSKKSSKLKLWFLDHWPIHGKSVLKQYYITKCATANKRIIIATPYFIPHHWLMTALRNAISRGVKVEVILPEYTDIWILDTANKVFAAMGYQSGIQFFFVPEMIHAKALLIDEKEGMIGSNNIDARSFDYNVESSIAFSEKNMVGDLRQILEHWEKSAIHYTFPKNNRRWYHGFIELIFKFLQPIL